MNPSVTANIIDLSHCDREQVQFSGAVQPHGCMLVIEDSSLRILQMSANCPEMLGLSLDKLRAGTLEAVLQAQTASVAQRLQEEPLDGGPVYLTHLKSAEMRTKHTLNLFAHRSSGVIMLEFEIAPDGVRPAIELYSELRATIAQLKTEKTLQSFFDLAVSRIQHFTGFERVMAYRFLEDGSGQILAELVKDGFQSYLGLHYPASDIPVPARRLFGLASLRHLPNADYEPVPLLPEYLSGKGEPLDLSYSMLRSVSAMYTGYLKNMGVQATMMMPLMKDGVLWGLLACHHESSPRHVPYEMRTAAEFLAHMISLMMAAKEDTESFAYRLRMKAALDDMARSLNERPDLHFGLGGGNGRASISDYIEAGGAALITEGLITRFGDTPSGADLKDLAVWLSANPDLVFATDRLPKLYPHAASYTRTAAGVLAVRLSKRRAEYVMWFRPGQAETVCWAGDPQKPVEVDTSGGAICLMPRRSFALWKESVEGRAKPWADFEIKAAADLRWITFDVIQTRAEEAEQAAKAKSEFLNNMSHELRTPMHAILSYSDMSLAGFGADEHKTIKKYIRNIRTSGKRLLGLLNNLLDLSKAQAGKMEYRQQSCDLKDLIEQSLIELNPLIAEKTLSINMQITAESTIAVFDEQRLLQVLVNIISNAIKFSDRGKAIQIHVLDGQMTSGERAICFRATDEGPGIPESELKTVFDKFSQSSTTKTGAGGTGLGLAICQEIIEAHGGEIWAENAITGGAVFCFSIPQLDIRE